MAKYICHGCKDTQVRLYRPYGEFFRQERVMCNACLDGDHRGWYVPFVMEEKTGHIWGYLAESQLEKRSDGQSDLERVLALPEKDTSLPVWTFEGWSDRRKR